MRFSVKVAPGVRLSASGRGLRAHVGPRAARVHVGGGRSGFSSGAGPVSFYTPLGGSHNSSSRPALSQQSGAKAGTGQVSAQLARSSKIEEGAAIAAVGTAAWSGTSRLDRVISQRSHDRSECSRGPVQLRRPLRVRDVDGRQQAIQEPRAVVPQLRA